MSERNYGVSDLMPWPKGKPRSPETKAKISAYMTGRRIGENSGTWKGGKSVSSEGYVLVLLRDHPNAMPNGYVKEHRLVMERHLGRLLKRDEIVHHVNGDKADNRIENLELMRQSDHVAEHRTGVRRSEETRRRISEARKARFAEGALTAHNKGKRRVDGRYV